MLKFLQKRTDILISNNGGVTCMRTMSVTTVRSL